MKKLTLSVGLLAGILTSSAQDTTCTYFYKKRVIEFNYQTSEILLDTVHEKGFYEIPIKYGNVLCLDLNDEALRMRKVIIEYFDGEKVQNVLDNIYYTKPGVVKVYVGRPRIIFLGCR